MRLIGVISAVAMLVPALVCAGEATGGASVGDVFEITKRYTTSGRATDGSTSSSRGSDTIVERIVGVSGHGLELEYDLASEATPEDRDRNWQFPARVLKPKSGPMQLLNADELEARAAIWLKAAGLTHADCGHWTFTWNAFRIDCDPQSVIQAFERFELGRHELRVGDVYQEKDALGSGTLQSKAKASGGEMLFVVMEIDPEGVRRSRAEADMVVGEIMRKPITQEEARRKRANEQVSGTISVTFEVDSIGIPQRRRKVTQREIKRPDGHTESEVLTEVVERRRLPAVPIRHRPEG